MVDLADIKEDRWALLNRTFTPTQPVTTRDIFHGRVSQLFDCMSIADQVGAHGILYGERGVGKTSIANVARIILNTPEHDARAIKVDCTSGDSFPDLMRHLYEQIKVVVHVPPTAGFNSDIDDNSQEVLWQVGSPSAPASTLSTFHRSLIKYQDVYL